MLLLELAVPLGLAISAGLLGLAILWLGVAPVLRRQRVWDSETTKDVTLAAFFVLLASWILFLGALGASWPV